MSIPRSAAQQRFTPLFMKVIIFKPKKGREILPDTTEEFLEITDSHGKAISIAPRSEIHGNPSLIHRVVHVLVFNKKEHFSSKSVQKPRM